MRVDLYNNMLRILNATHTELFDGWNIITYLSAVGLRGEYVAPPTLVSYLSHYHPDKNEYYTNMYRPVECKCQVPGAVILMLKLECLVKNSQIREPA